MKKILKWLLIVAVGYLIVSAFYQQVVLMPQMTCEEFAKEYPNTSTRNVPARCLYYYNEQHG